MPLLSLKFHSSTRSFPNTQLLSTSRSKPMFQRFTSLAVLGKNLLIIGSTKVQTYPNIIFSALYFTLIFFNLGGQLLVNLAGFVIPAFYSLQVRYFPMFPLRHLKNKKNCSHFQSLLNIKLMSHNRLYSPSVKPMTHSG